MDIKTLFFEMQMKERIANIVRDIGEDYREQARETLEKRIHHKDFEHIIRCVANINENTRYLGEVLSIIDKHQGAIGFAEILDSLIGAKRGNYLETAIPVFESFKFTTTLYTYQHGGRAYDLIKSIDSMCDSYNNIDVVKQRMDFYFDDKINDAILKYEGRMNKILFRSIVDASSKDFVWQVIEVFEKYKTHLKYILDEFWDEGHDEIRDIKPSALLNDKAYNEVIRSRNPGKLIRDLMTKNYSVIQICIKDVNFVKGVSYEDLSLLESTVEFVSNMTKERSSEDKTKINDGFWAELNRAISQGETFDEKSKYLRQYCHEVKVRMKDNASELMVIHYG